MSSPLPSPRDVRELLADVLGRRVKVAPDVPFAPAGAEHVTFAVYVDDHLRTTAVVVLDLVLSAHVGAAFGLVPVGGTDTAIEHQELSPLLADNLAEVLATLASLLNAPGRPHVRLHATYPPGATPPSDLPGYAAVTGRRLDLTVDISGYGAGRLSVVCLP